MFAMSLMTDVGADGYDHKRQLEELIHVAGFCIEVLQQNDEYLADVSFLCIFIPAHSCRSVNSRICFSLPSKSVFIGQH